MRYMCDMLILDNLFYRHTGLIIDMIILPPKVCGKQTKKIKFLIFLTSIEERIKCFYGANEIEDLKSAQWTEMG